MLKKFAVINRKILPYQKNVDKNFFDIEKSQTIQIINS